MATSLIVPTPLHPSTPPSLHPFTSPLLHLSTPLAIHHSNPSPLYLLYTPSSLHPFTSPPLNSSIPSPSTLSPGTPSPLHLLPPITSLPFRLLTSPPHHPFTPFSPPRLHRITSLPLHSSPFTPFRSSPLRHSSTSLPHLFITLSSLHPSTPPPFTTSTPPPFTPHSLTALFLLPRGGSYSGGQACWRHSAGSGHAVRPGEECPEALSPDPLQPLPQDQRQAGRHQQHPGAEREVRVLQWPACIQCSHSVCTCVVRCDCTMCSVHVVRRGLGGVFILYERCMVYG